MLLVCEGNYCGAIGYLHGDFTGEFLGKNFFSGKICLGITQPLHHCIFNNFCESFEIQKCQLTIPKLTSPNLPNYNNPKLTSPNSPKYKFQNSPHLTYPTTNSKVRFT